MNIGYRRYSGKAFLEPSEVKSKRGAWLEKRIALFKVLADRGHSVSVIRNEDRFGHFDKIIMEFGSLNRMFHKDDIGYSEYIASQRDVFFLLDDPDLFPTGLRIKEMWANSGDPQRCESHWRVPTVEFPIFGLQTLTAPSEKHNGKIVYYGGTSGGREKRLMLYQRQIPGLEIYGAKKDYQYLEPKDPPTQEQRANFYHGFKASLNITDSRHKKLSWNTGRKYHSIAAGCPVLDEVSGFQREAETLDDAEYRMLKIGRQQAIFPVAQRMCLDVLEKHGL